jgi:hypothetical protein
MYKVYKLKDLQGAHCKEDYIFKTKKELRINLIEAMEQCWEENKNYLKWTLGELLDYLDYKLITILKGGKSGKENTRRNKS